MTFIPKTCFLFVRLWRGIARRILCIYYKLALGSLGHGTTITSKVFIDHPYNVLIGNKVTINQFVTLQGSPNAKITIGDGVDISYGVLILTASRILENGVYLLTHSNKSVIIEDDVWIAANAVILPGITVGKGSVVAAGAVVTRNVAPYTVVAGVPARPINYLKSQ